MYRSLSQLECTRSWRLIVHRKANQVHPHPDYSDRWPYLHDIAILRLEPPLSIVDSTSRLAKTCVPDDRRPSIVGFPRPNAHLIVVGWHSLRSHRKTPNVLQQTVVRLLDEEDTSCSSAVQNAGYQFCSILFEGDQNSKLISWCTGKYIITRGDGCDLVPGIGLYTRLSFYKEWMRRVMNSPLPVYPASRMIQKH